MSSQKRSLAKGELRLLSPLLYFFWQSPFFAVGRHPFLKSDIYGTKAQLEPGEREESFLHVYSLVIDSKKSLKILYYISVFSIMRTKKISRENKAGQKIVNKNNNNWLT